MTTRLSRRNIARLVAAGATILSIGCGVNPSEPIARTIRPASEVRHDDDPSTPPTDPCRSGWTIESGRWVCNDK